MISRTSGVFIFRSNRIWGSFFSGRIEIPLPREYDDPLGLFIQPIPINQRILLLDTKVTRSHVTDGVFKLGARFLDTFSSQTLLNKDRQCCESWKAAELGVRAVCVVGDTTDEDR